MWVMLQKSQGGTFGPLGGTPFDIEYDDATALFTGIKKLGLLASHDVRFQLEIIADSIQPMNILQIGMEVDVGS